MILNKRIPKIFSSHKSTYIGMIILVILSTSCYIGFKTSSASIIENVKHNRSTAIMEDANFTLTSPLSDDAINNYEKDFSLTLEENQWTDLPDAFNKATLRLIPEAKKLNLPTVYEGEYLKNSKDIMVDRYFFTAQKLKFGDKLKIFDTEYTICGVFTTPNNLIVRRLDTDFMADGSKFGLVMFSQEDFNLLPKDTSSLNYSVKFKLDNEDTFHKALGNENYVISWEPKETNYRIATYDSESKAILILSMIAPLFLLLISTIILSVVLSRMLKGEYIYIGTLTALGYKKSQILAHYLLLPTIITIIGSILGLVLGYYLIGPFSLITSIEYNIPKTVFKLKMLDIAIVMLLPLGLNICAVTLTVYKSLNMSIINLLKGDPSNKKATALIKLVPYKKGSFKLRFKLKETLTNIPRSMLMLIGIFTASMFMISGFLFYNAIDFLFDINFNTLFGYKYQYIYNTTQTEKSSEGDPYMMASFFYEKEGERINFTLNGISNNSEFIKLKDIDGNLIDNSKTVATRSVAKRMGWEKGDSIIIVSNSSLKKEEIIIDDICDIPYSDYLYMPMEKVNNFLNLPKNSHIGLYSKVPLQIDKSIIKNTLLEKDSNAGIETSIAAFRSFLYILAGFASVISLIIVYIVSMMLIEENRKNISVLKVMGYHNKEVSRLLLTSSSILLWIGFLIAIPITLKIIGIFFDILTSNMYFDFSINLVWWHGLLSFILILMVYYVTLSFAKRKVFNINMSESLKAKE